MTSSSNPLRIGIIGEPTPGYRKHQATVEALDHAAGSLSTPILHEWIPTNQIARAGAPAALDAFDALVAPPQSPVRNVEGAMQAIRYARERRRPFLATCGGFQNTLLEYARGVLGIEDASHEEYGDADGVPVIARVSCSLDRPAPGTYSLSGLHRVRIRQHTLAAHIYGCDVIEEEISCNYALNPAIQSECERTGLRVSGIADDGSARIVELVDHPFFVATLFLPQFSSSAAIPHPLVTEFLEVAVATRARDSHTAHSSR